MEGARRKTGITDPATVSGITQKMDAMVHGRMAMPMPMGAKTPSATTDLVMESGGKTVQATVSSAKVKPRTSPATIGGLGMPSDLPVLQKKVGLGIGNHVTRQSATTSL
jgi:hypothetical protein